jgi:hypothetical protein
VRSVCHPPFAKCAKDGARTVWACHRKAAPLAVNLHPGDLLSTIVTIPLTSPTRHDGIHSTSSIYGLVVRRN